MFEEAVEQLESDARAAWRSGACIPARHSFDYCSSEGTERCALGAAIGGYAACPPHGSYVRFAAEKYGGTQAFWKGYWHGFDGINIDDSNEEFMVGHKAGARFALEIFG